MKIAIYWIGKNYGGVEEVLKNLLKFWPDSKDRFYLFTNTGSNNGYKRIKKEYLFKKVFNVQPDWIEKDFLILKIIKYFFFPFFYFKYYHETYNELKLTKNNFDVLLVNNGGYPGSWKSMIALKSAKDLGIEKRYLLIHHGAVHDKFLLRTGEKYLDKKVQEWSTKIFAISKATRDSLIKTRNFMSKNFTIIHNGIILINKKKKLHTIKKTIYLGILGRIEKYKGHDNILKALSFLKKDEKFKIKLLIAGKFISDQEKTRIRNLIKAYDIKNNVKFLGYVSKKRLDYFYYNLDLFFSLTKDFEGFGLTILEAMNRGIPVICTNVGGVREFANNNSVTFVKPDDYMALLNVIKKYLRNANFFKKKINHAIRVSEKFSSNKMAKNYYEQITKNI